MGYSACADPAFSGALHQGVHDHSLSKGDSAADTHRDNHSQNLRDGKPQLWMGIHGFDILNFLEQNRNRLIRDLLLFLFFFSQLPKNGVPA